MDEEVLVAAKVARRPGVASAFGGGTGVSRATGVEANGGVGALGVGVAWLQATR